MTKSRNELIQNDEIAERFGFGAIRIRYGGSYAILIFHSRLDIKRPVYHIYIPCCEHPPPSGRDANSQSEEVEAEQSLTIRRTKLLFVTNEPSRFVSSALCYCTAVLLSSRGHLSSVVVRRPSVRPSSVDIVFSDTTE